MNTNSITILITTKDRVEELKITLATLESFMNNGGKIIICDDGSEDHTANIIIANFPRIKIVRNEKNMGLIYSRNILLNMVNTPYAISLDDDSNFIGLDPFHNIISHFSQNENCAVIAFRIFWGTEVPKKTTSQEATHRVKSFVGCGHAWEMKAWRSIPDYPSWYKFYGEEDFASFHLFKKNWEVHYLPEVLVHHRADIKARKKEMDYIPRLRSSLRAGWNNYFIFYPASIIPRRMAYSIWIQLKQKVFNGEPKVGLALVTATIDLFGNSFNLIKNRNPFTKNELRSFAALPDTKIYWIPENE